MKTFLNGLVVFFKGFLIGAVIGLVLAGIQVARADDVPPLDSPHWMHGKKAIMDVYTIDAATLDVLATNEFAFDTADACANAMSKAMVIANAEVPKGALAIVKCFAASKGADGAVKPGKPGVTEL